MRIRIPATTANLGCGYDTFGMALGYYNYIEIAEADTLSLNLRGQGVRYLPQDDSNLLLRSVQAVYDLCGKGKPLMRLTSYNNIPLSRGMGSSSAAIVGGVFAANQALACPLDQAAMLDLVTELEGHPDNVAPALLGGFTVVVQEERQYVRRISLPARLKAVLAVPNFHISTKKARTILPAAVPLADAVYNLSHAALLALALREGDLQQFGAMLKDRLHQPYRFPLVKGAPEVVEAACAAGALGCVLSGSGPTMIAFTDGGKESQEKIGAAMTQAFAEHSVRARIFKVNMDNQGTVILQQKTKVKKAPGRLRRG